MHTYHEHPSLTFLKTFKLEESFMGFLEISTTEEMEKGKRQVASTSTDRFPEGDPDRPLLRHVRRD